MIGRCCTAIAAMILASPSTAVAQTPPAGYQPQDEDERGLWMEMEEVEREFAHSNFVVRDAALNRYVRDVLCRTVGEARCAAARIFIVRTPYFNASMAPNGMMQIWTGLLLRTRNEAQLAAVLGHEFAHFEARHSLRGFRDMRAKTDVITWLSFLPYGVGTIAAVGQVGGLFANNREMEREADVASIGYLAAAGYATDQAARVWGQLRDEQDATAAARRRKSRKDKNGGFFATHPNSAERMAYLAAEAGAAKAVGAQSSEVEYRVALAPWWAALIDDQVKLNDFGGTEFLLASLADRGGWSGELLYARGELYRQRGNDDDLVRATGFYRDALAAGSPLPEIRRGLGLVLLRSSANDEGRAMLRDYLQTMPNAGDRAIIAALAEAAE